MLLACAGSPDLLVVILTISQKKITTVRYRNMEKVQKHRGPDEQENYLDSHFGLAM